MAATGLGAPARDHRGRRVARRQRLRDAGSDHRQGLDHLRLRSRQQVHPAVRDRRRQSRARGRLAKTAGAAERRSEDFRHQPPPQGRLKTTVGDDESASRPELSAGPELRMHGAEALRADVAVVSRARILFGHQSVGRDIVAGAQSVAAAASLSLHVRHVDAAASDDRPGLYHATIGRNGDPLGKCDAFVLVLSQAARRPYDLALMKFCYVDLDRNSRPSVDELLEGYAERVRRIHEAWPALRIVHVTMPLRSEPAGRKTYVKRLLGLPLVEDEGNRLRNQFNSALAALYEREPVFDLALAESTRSTGARSSAGARRGPFFTMCPEYTDDGGHLNELGQWWVGAAFLAALANGLRRSDR